MATVNSVSGPLDTADLGFTLMHEHIIVQTPGVRENFPVWDRAAELYPTNPRTRISAAKAWYELWRTSGAADAARRARTHVAEALRIDDTRPAQEVARLRPRERAEAEALLKELNTTSSAPATSTPAR